MLRLCVCRYLAVMKSSFHFFAALVLALGICSGNAQTVTNSPATNSISVPKPLKDFMLPAPKNGGFMMDGYVLWCSSVIKVGDTYHMFASAWPGHQTTNGWRYSLGDWTSQSECVRATSTNLFGPYTFQEVVLQKRADKWDNSRVHNVKIVKAGKKFVLFYINSANQTGYAVADSVTGPWTRVDAPVIKASNPAPIVNPNGSVYVFCRLRDSDGVNRGVGYIATNYDAPYEKIKDGDNLLPDGGELEDPT
ncbi:MAG TPA: glycoside hydrolase family protein, partial [Candidatus Baltobacteraceae bacterium]|nr:glycoside hydrolase family protein [Candidatus Baltobacteraceae bacterium]